MAQDPTSVSPGYYSATAYDVLSKYDPAFSENVSVEGFFENLQNPEYAAKAYAILADADPELVNNLSLDEFISNVKKKEVTDVTESVSDVGSSVLLPSTEVPEGGLLPEVNQFGNQVDELGVELPKSDSPFELMDYRKRRAEATSERDTPALRLADQVQAEEMERFEQERDIAARSMPSPPEVGDQMAVDYIQQLRDVYGPYGIRFETDYYDPNNKFGEIRALGIGADGNAVEFKIDVNKGKIDQSDLSGLNEFLQSNARAKGGLDVDKRSLSEKALRVQQMRPVARLNEDGSQSTVLMASAEADGRHFAYPTLFPTGDGFSADPKNWTELDPDAAFEEAQRRGELFEFDTAEEAQRFAEGEWKEIRETDAIAEQMWAERGRNYYADEMFLRKVEEKKREYEFLESLVPGGDKAIGRMGAKRLDEMEIPPAYQQYLVTYTDERGEKTLIARTDLEEVRQQKERELAALEQQFDNDNELLRLKEDYDELLGKKRGEVMERAAALNQEGKAVQNRADVASINRFGVPVKGLLSMQPQTEGEYNEMLGLLTQYNTGIEQRRTAALQYEKNKLYYDAQHEKLINQEYVDGWEEVSMKWSNGLKRGNAMSRLLLMHYGYYDVIGDEKAEEEAMREVSAIMDSMDTRVGRATSRTNMTGTTESFLERINPLDAGMDAATYTAALTAESLGQLLPIWYRILPVAAAGGAAYGAAGGPLGSTFGAATSTIGAAGMGAIAAVTTVGMPVSELALEMGNAILEVGEKKGYDWADPNSALLALNDESVWKEGADRGYKRGVPIALMGMVSNMAMAKMALGGSKVLPFAERLAIGVGTGVTIEPATEMLGEYLAIKATGEYTGSTANVKEIAAEGLGAIGMGVGFTTSMAALGYAKDVVTDANFDLALRLMDPEGIAKENVRGERIVSFANRMERLGKIDAEQAEAIRKNVGRRRQANELLGKKIDSRPGSDSQVIGRIVELLEAKEELERSGANVFSEKIRAITEEIALIAESGKVEKPGGAAVNLSDIRGRIRNRRPGVYKFNGKKVTREDFMAKIQEATPRQLKRARAYNDIEAQRELINRRDAIQKREAAEVPVGEEPGVSPQVDQQVREATQEDLQAEEQGTLDPDRKAVILESIAEKLNDKVELNEVEQAFLEDNKEDIEADQKRLETLDQAAADVEVVGEPEVEGRVPLKRLKRLASNAKKALAKNFPDANIIIHNDKASYKQAAQENGLTGEGSAGFIGTDDKTIHIFAPLASETTIAHETFHAILRNTIDSAQTQELMGEFVTTLKKVIPADSILAAKLDRYQQLYDAGQMNEEYVAEFFGELAAAYPTLDKKGKSVIARFLERLGKLLGVELTLPTDLTARDKQIISLLERLAGQVSRGETVTARETEALRSLTTDRQQAEVEPEVEVEPEAEPEVEAEAEVEIPYETRRSIARIKMTTEQLAEADELERESMRLFDELNEAEKQTGLLAKRRIRKAKEAFLEAANNREAFYEQFGRPTEQNIADLNRYKEIVAERRQLRDDQRLAGKPGIFGIPSQEEFGRMMEALSAEQGRIMSRIRTKENLSAAEQRVDNFSDEQLQAMADEGVIFHFSDVDITKVLPEKLKRFAFGYGFYFTNYALEDSTYRSFGDRITMVNAEDFNLLDGDKALTREQAKLLSDAAKLELQEAEEYGDMLGFEEEQVLMSLSTVQAFDLWGRLLSKNTNGVAGKGRSFTSDMTDEQMATVTRLVQEMLGFDGIVYGRPSRVGKTGAITVVWNFPKIDRAIIEPGQEPTRAAEQRTIGYEGEQESLESIINRGLLDFRQDAEQSVKRASEIKVVSDDAELNEFLQENEDQLKEIAQYWFSGTRENVRRDVAKELIARENARRLAGDMILDHVGLYTGDVQWMPNIEVQAVRGGGFEIVLTPLTEAQKQSILDAQDAYDSTQRHGLRYTAYESMDALADGYFYAVKGSKKMRRGTGGFAAGNQVHFAVSKTDASASNRVLYHEVLHGLLNVANNMDKAKVTEAAKLLREGLEEVDYAMTPELKQAFDNFLSSYPEGRQNEEFVVDFFGQLASGYRSMSAEARALVNRFVDAVYEIFNLKPANREYVERGGFVEDPGVRTAEQAEQYNRFEQYVQDTLNALAQKVVSGEVITEEELSRISAETLTSEMEGRAAEQRVVDSTNGTFLIPVESDVSSVAQVGFDPKSETHVTIIGFPNGRKVMRAIKQNPAIEQAVNRLIARSDFRFTPTGRAFEIEKEYAAYRDQPAHTRQALIEEVEMPGLARFYGELSELIGEELAVPYPHISLGTRLDPRGIGINSVAEFEALNPKPVALPQNITYVEQVPDPNQDFAPGTRKMIRIGGGRIEIAGNKTIDRYGILELFVPEDQRRQGIGTQLVAAAIEEADGKLAGMASKDAAVTINYNLGMRYYKPDGTEATLEETKRQRAANSYESIFMTTPEARNAPRRAGAEQRVVTNEDGSPKTFYHGTDATFEEFVPTEGTRTVLGVDIPVTAPAFFFTEDEAVAREYGKNVIPVNLSFAKMVQDNVAEAGRIMKEVFPDGFEFSNGVINYDEYSRDENWISKVLDDELGLDWMLLDEPEFVDALKAAGFDGTLVYESDDETSVAAFDNSNIQRLDREPRAAEQRIDIDAVRTRSRAGNRVSKGLATYNVDGVAQVEEIENLTRDYVREQAPEAYIKNANIIAKYPLVRGVREFGDITTVEQADELYDIYTQQTMDNLRWMMETYPDEFSEISTLWYDGANKIANELATEFGVTPEQAAGILAALSPQKDWYQNAHLARLLLEAFADNPVMTREMVNYQRKFTKNKIAGKKKALKKARAAKGKSRAKAKVDKFNKDKARLLNDVAVAEALLESIAALEGTRMLDADPSMMGYYVRLHSETTKQPSYPVISPDGEMAGPALKDNGQPAKWAWGSYNEIGKGVSINLNGSPENITISLGQQHKVRNFFNNIIDPMSAEGDVTMDTHAIAVSLLKPLSTASAEVEHNFGSKEVSNSGAKGIKGTYYANQEAYQMLAEELGLLPRQVQSVTWEAVRGLFTDKFKANKENVKAINQIWENYADGKITIDEARAQVLERAGGINPPVWAESVQGESREGVREGRERGAGRTGGRAAEQQVFVNERGTEFRRAGESRMRPMTLETLENFVYRSGKVTDKAEPRGMMSGGRSTGHFGTGAYFFSDRKRAEEYDDRDVTAVDIRDYNLAPASKELHNALRDVNTTFRENFSGGFTQYPEDEFSESDFFRVIMALGRYDEFYAYEQLDMDASDEVLQEQMRRNSEVESRRTKLRADAKRMYNEPGNIDSRSTVVMKVLGYDGVYARPRSDMDNSTYGTVIYDVKPGAAEQRVAGPELAKVLQRYEFKTNNSLKNAELAPELRRNLKRFGYGVKQYGTRMNDFRVVSLDTGRAVDPNKLIEEGLAEGLAIAEEQRAFEAEQRARELEERIIEIYNADERPYTGKDFEGRAAEQKVVVEAMAEPGTIADLVARGRELGLRDASIRSVLLKRFGKDNADAIDTALTEYFDMFRAIPEAFGNVEGGIEVGRQIYDDVRRQLDEFARPKKPGRMTKRERTDRLAELRAKFPEQKKLSDTELLRKHPRQAVAPSIAEVRAEALNLLRNNRLFNEQTTEVQEQLLVAFDKTLQTRANKQVNTLISQIRNNIRQRRKGVSNANKVRNELKKMLTELLPAGKYTKAEAKAITTLVNNVTEDNMLVQIEKLMGLVEKKAKADIKAELQDIMKLDRRIRSERKYAERELKQVQKNLRRLVNEVLPRADYTKTDVNRINKLVNEVNENNYDDKAEQVLKIVDKKREQIRQGVIKDIVKFVRGAAKTRRTPTGKVRPRSLDAPGQAYFREADRILRAILDKDQSLIMDIAANLANNPLVDVATQKMLNGEKLTTREQQLVDQKSALDMFADIKDKSLEEVEAILQDLKVDAAFSRANLKATRAARAERLNVLREGAKAEVQDNWAGFATNEDGSAKSRNQLEADKTQKKTIGDALKENGLRAKYDALVEWAKEGKRITPAQIARLGKNITHVGALTGIMGEYFRENLYKRLGKLEERHLQGIFNTKKKLDEIAATIDGIENYKDITDLIFTSNPDGLMVNTKATGRRRLSTDEMMRIYALSKNPVQRAKLESMGFTDAVLNQIVDTIDNRLIEFVDKTVDYLANDYYEGINDVYRKVNDINLGYIENYFPTRTQVKGDLSVKSKEETLSSTFFGPNAQVATALKERTDQKGEILMDQNVGFHGELGNHFSTMERFKAYAEAVQEMNAILSSDYTVALASRLEADAMLNMLIAHGVTPDMFMSEMKFKSLDSLISKYTGASLAFKLMQIPKQATSFLGGFQQYRFGDKPNPIVDLIMFSFDYAVLLPQILLEGITLGKYKGPIASIAEDSATFRARLESNFSGDVYGLTAGVSGRPRKVSEKDYTTLRKAATALRKGSGSATAFGDILGVLGYLPAYNRNRMRGMSQEEAIDKFNEYNETQQSRRPGERAPIQILQNGLTRAFMAFTSSQILYLNNSLRHANNISKALRTGQKVKAEDSRGLIFNAIMSSVLFTLASNMFILLYGNDEEKERAYRDTFASPLKNLFSIPVWGAAMEEFYNLYVGNKYPSDVAVNPLGRVVRDVKKVATGGDVSTAVKEVSELALGTNFDPGLSLINIAAGEPIEPELYDLIGVPKSARPE